MNTAIVDTRLPWEIEFDEECERNERPETPDERRIRLVAQWADRCAARRRRANAAERERIKRLAAALEGDRRDRHLIPWPTRFDALSPAAQDRYRRLEKRASDQLVAQYAADDAAALVDLEAMGPVITQEQCYAWFKKHGDAYQGSPLLKERTKSVKVLPPVPAQPAPMAVPTGATSMMGTPAFARDLIMGNAGRPESNVENATIMIGNTPNLASAIAFDEMQQTVMLVGPLGDKHVHPRPLVDSDAVIVQRWLQRGADHGQYLALRNVGLATVHDAIEQHARENPYHPVRDHLKTLSWDRIPRLATWLHRYLGTANTPYESAIGQMFLIAMVARIFRPGCQADYMLVLEGPQGARKSTACRILAGQEHFTDNLPEITSKDASQHLRGKWIVEVAEMVATSRADAEALKHFITRRVESYRPSYGRRDVYEPRQCVFIGTTNQATYLKDDTGGRRFWPVAVGYINTDLLQADRDQLFAEAVALFQGGAQWWPDAEFEQTWVKPQQESRFDVDIIEEEIGAWLARNPNLDQITVAQVANLALGKPAGIGRADQNRITKALTRLGWKRGQRGTGGVKLWVKA